MSAFNLGSIRAVLGIETGNYTKGLLDAQVANEVFGQSVTNFINNPLLGTVSLLKDAAIGTAKLVKDTAFHNQELLRTADRLGTNVELVSGLQGAYKGFGQDSAGVERQLTKLNQQIGEAASGNTTAQQTFAALGVALRDQDGNARDFTAVFYDVVDALGATENQSLKVALAQKLFGEDVSRVLDIVGRGRGVLEAYLEQARKLGEVFTREQVEQADQAASALDNLNRAYSGLRASLAQELITGFVGEQFDSSNVEDLATVLREKLGPATESLGRNLRVIADNLERIEKVGEFVWDRLTFAGDQPSGDYRINPRDLEGVNVWQYMRDPDAELQRNRQRHQAWISNTLLAARQAI